MSRTIHEIKHLMERRLYESEPNKCFIYVCVFLALADEALEWGDYLEAAHQLINAAFASGSVHNNSMFRRMADLFIALHDDMETKTMLGGSKPLLSIKWITVKNPTPTRINEAMIGRLPELTPPVSQGPARM